MKKIMSVLFVVGVVLGLAGCSDKPKPVWSTDQAQLAIETKLGVYRGGIEEAFRIQKCWRVNDLRASVESPNRYDGQIPLALLEGGRAKHSMLEAFDKLAVASGCRSSALTEPMAFVQERAAVDATQQQNELETAKAAIAARSS